MVRKGVIKRTWRCAEIARALGLSALTISRRFEAGEIQGTKVGSQWMATRVDLVRFLGKERFMEIFEGKGEPVA